MLFRRFYRSLRSNRRPLEHRFYGTSLLTKVFSTNKRTSNISSLCYAPVMSSSISSRLYFLICSSWDLRRKCRSMMFISGTAILSCKLPGLDKSQRSFAFTPLPPIKREIRSFGNMLRHQKLRRLRLGDP